MTHADGFASVWDAIADTPGEAAIMRTKSELLRQLQAAVKAAGWSVEDLAARCDVDQANKLLQGRIGSFSLDQLVTLASALGFGVRFDLQARN